jgi:opacity protein-like surface antigen
MANNFRGLSIKKNLVFAFVFIIMIGSFLPHSYGEEGSKVKYGFSVMGGAGDALYKNPDTTVFGFLPRVDLALHRNWDLEFEGNFSYWNISGEKNLYFLGVNGNIVFKPIQWDWGSFFLLAGGGLGYDSAGKNGVNEIGDSHCGGVYQAGAGIYYNLPKGLALRVEYRFYHISEPFRSDRGLYTHTALLGISF